jgi:putative thioredoxin
MMAAMTNVVDVTDADFERVVIEGSRERPVVVDLWASWCGPCRALSPILERAAGERAGAFLLAKVDVDANPMISASFGVRSIPTVIAFRDGEPVNGFVGAIPERMVNEFLDSLLPTEADLAAEAATAEAAAGDLASAERTFRDALVKDPGNRDATVGLAELLAAEGELTEAEELVRPLLPDPAAERVMARIRVASWADLEGPSTLASAKRLAAHGRWREALDGMLSVLADDREAARAAIVDVLALLGDEDPLVPEYRRRLASALF